MTREYNVAMKNKPSSSTGENQAFNEALKRLVPCVLLGDPQFSRDLMAGHLHAPVLQGV
jgi:hypothetical protein